MCVCVCVISAPIMLYVRSVHIYLYEHLESWAHHLKMSPKCFILATIALFSVTAF